MEIPVRRKRSPAIKLLFAVLVATALSVLRFMVYALVWGRQDQSRTARATITQGWGGGQVATGPVLIVRYAVIYRTSLSGKARFAMPEYDRN